MQITELGLLNSKIKKKVFLLARDSQSRKDNSLSPYAPPLYQSGFGVVGNSNLL